MSINIASPGAKSVTVSNPSEFRATLSDEIPQEKSSPLLFFPNTNGRIPFGSRNANSPYPAIIPTTAYPPEHLLCKPFTALNKSSGFRLGASVLFRLFSSSFAKIFSRISESELVLMCLKFSL